MDIGNFFENLDKEYKKVLMALIFIFPMAYADCWKLSIAFKSYDIIPQIILAFGVSFLLMAGGVVLDIIYLVFSASRRVTMTVNLPTIIMPTIPPTFLVLINRFDNVTVFCKTFIGYIIAVILGFIVKIVYRFFKNKSKNRKRTEDNDESQGSPVDLSQDH